MGLSSEEKIRYSRHISIPSFGLEGQEKLKIAKVLIIGVGGLGSPALLYLAAAGIGTIGIVDDDIVDISNLQRQVLYSMEDIGNAKIEVAKAKILAANPEINIITHHCKLTSDNAEEIVKEYDIVIDGTDNFPTRYLVNDVCVLLNKINVYGSVYRFEGQVSVFNYIDENGQVGPNYRDLYPEPPTAGSVPNCAEGGVLGVLPGIIGTMQANEVIKLLVGIGEPLIGKLLLFDALTLESRKISFRKNPDTSITKLIDYEEFCGTKTHNNMSEVKEITVKELKEWKDSEKDFQLIDCREQYEFDFANLAGELIPLGNILEQKLYNLKGGILAWSAEVDPSVPTY